MKKLFLIFALGANACLNAQGWVGNSVNNSIVPYNSSLGLSPVNVGIGVSSPSEQLHTNSGVRFEGLQRNDTPNRIIVQNTTGKLFWRDAASIGGGNNWRLTGNNNAVNPGVAANQNYLGTNTNDRVVFATGGLNAANQIVPMERMTILPGVANEGSVGIGTSTPTSLLTVGSGSSGLGNQANQGYLFKSVGSADSTVEHLGFFNNDQRTSRSEITISNSGNSAGRWEDNFIAMMVHGDNFTYLGRNDYYLGQNNSGYAIINAQSNTGDSTVLKKFTIGVRNDLTPLSFYTNNIERIYIKSDGDIGIGTNAPQNKLHVEGGARITDLPTMTSGDNLVFADANGDLRSLSQGAPNTFLSGNGTWQTVAAGATTNSLVFTNPGTITSTVNGVSSSTTIPVNTSNTTNTCGILNMIPRLNGTHSYTCSQLFDNNASVGIGTTTGFNYTTFPTTNRLTGATVPAANGVYRLSIQGPVRAQAYWAYSDKNLKTEIYSISNSSNIINALVGKTYKWTEEFQKEANVDNSFHYGFIAQEVEKVMPEAVIKDANGRYAVEYNAFIPVLVESQKEIMKENEKLKSRLSVMEEKFALLERSISQVCESGCAGLTKTTPENLLFQSIPNPTDKDALVNYFLIKEDAKAKIVLFTQEGKDMEFHNLEPKKGNGSIRLSLDGLSNGTYLYSLIVEGKVIDTKRLQIIK